MKEIKIGVEDKTGLSGHPFGEKIYNEYVKNNIDLNSDDKYILIFPDSIKIIGVSFIKGFTKAIFKEITSDQFFDYFEIRGSEFAVEDFKAGVDY